MTRRDDIALGPVLDRWFSEMTIPGDGVGIAIRWSTEALLECTALGRTVHGGIGIHMIGEPFKVVNTREIDRNEYLRLLASTDCSLKRTGIIAAEDIVDGESYLIKWCSGEEETRLMLCNPRDMGDEAVRLFAEKLDALCLRFKPSLITRWANRFCGRA